jgi:hypothetical protein
MVEPLLLGTETDHGRVGGIVFTGGERYYLLLKPNGVVSLLPWFVVEGE